MSAVSKLGELLHGVYGQATRVPAIPDTRNAKPSDVLEVVKEWIEVREGTRGDGLDRAVTLRDLLNSGLATPFDLTGMRPGQPPPIPLTPGNTDPDIPPTPENLVAVGAFKNIILTWDFARGYSRLAYFEIWRSLTDAIGDATLVAQTFGTIYADEVGPGKAYYYWVRAVSDAPAQSPFNALAGTLGATAMDPGYLIDLLEGQITETELHQALGARINLIDGATSLAGSVNARVAAALTTASQALAAARAELEADIGANGSAIVALQETDVNHALSLSLLGTRADTAESGILTLQETTAGHALSLQTLDSRTDGAESNITTLQQTTGSQAASITSLSTRMGDAESAITQIAESTSGSATVIEALETRVDGAESNITTLQQTTSGQASSINNLSTTVGGHTTTIGSHTTSIGGLSGQHTVKIDSNNYVTGYGLASTPINGTPSSSFAVRADSFSIASPQGPGVAPAMPFIVRTTATTINGVAVPVGVYLRDVFIQNGSISTAMIGNLMVDDAKIANMSVAKLRAGKLGVSEYLESTNYAAGDTGFRIHGNGNAEFSNVTARGTIYATAGHIGDILINPGNGIYSSNYSSTAGFHISSSGVATLNQAVIRGSLIGVTGTFSGDISGASGSFIGGVRGGTGYADHTTYTWPTNGGIGYHLSGSGALFGNPTTGKYFQVTDAGNLYAPEFRVENGHAYFGGELTAQAINAVDTINLRGQAVTIPLSAYGVDSVGGSFAGDNVILQSLTIVSTGAPILLTASGMYNTEAATCYFIITRNDTTIYSCSLAPGVSQQPFCAAVADTPGVGTFTYQWRVRVDSTTGTGGGYVANRALTLLETKR